MRTGTILAPFALVAFSWMVEEPNLHAGPTAQGTTQDTGELIREKIMIAERMVEIAEQILPDVRGLFEAGRGNQHDVVLAERAVQEAQSRVLEYRTELLRAAPGDLDVQGLARLIGERIALVQDPEGLSYEDVLKSQRELYRAGRAGMNDILVTQSDMLEDQLRVVELKQELAQVRRRE